MSNFMTGSQVAAKQVEVKFCTNEEVLNAMSKALAFAINQSNSTIKDVMGLQALEACFKYALSVVLALDSGAKPIHDAVPNFFTDLFMSLNSQYRGVRIMVGELKPMPRPSEYDDFVALMQSVGLPMGRPAKVDPYTTSKVAQYGVKNFDDVPTLVGVERDNVSIEELVVRSMLTASAKEQDKLDRILGHLDYMYVSVDELARNWACSLPTGNC